MALRFETPHVIYTGRGAHINLKDLGVLEGKKSALMIIDASKVEKEVEEHCKKDLSALGISTAEYRDIGERTTPEQIDAGLEILRSSGAEVIIAMGGITVIQAGKLIGLLATNGGKIHDYKGVNRSKKPSLPVIAMAMSAGGGAALSHCACFTDAEAKCRCCIFDKHLIPAAAILDPGLTGWQSPRETARDGVLSIGYAIESITSTRATPVTDACALAAIRAISRWLPVAHANGSDLEAREQVMFAQQLVSMAMSNSSPSIICKLAGQIEARTHIQFSDSIAALVPWLLELYEDVVPEKVSAIGQALRDGEKTAYGDRPVKAADQFRNFIERLELPLHLSFLGLEESIIPDLAHSMYCGDLPDFTPYPMSEQVFLELLKKAL